ncbi:RNA 2',3'-cyclic phosphodiesterase [Tessaracoccus sp. OH4464_COT-324]|uniref:RNA 2',3'-cyclic phosphodiesterase n=1 Tax=Tessaracoccus sp. OH4464_COT-324 TaxID=2491059 RepID=UPI000F6311B4|nr:RNA 2',3'-cyclic phosphodiesterase [Tessaracoccus sp. OH4464_COT-324]RRD46829.1 RNA 2',3'-cyclic phosphodiesterase [Tessaracoccus sp. OH4464_COT-324]
MGDRLFAAVLPPGEMIDELSRLLGPLRASGEGLRWTRPAGWHVTTAFMADVPDTEAVRSELARAARGVAPFRLRIGGGLAFPRHASGHLLALAVESGHDELARLAAQSRAAAARAGAAADESEFVGHLTLARAKAGTRLTEWVERLDGWPRWEFVAREVALVRSFGMGRGYEVLERTPLGVG